MEESDYCGGEKMLSLKEIKGYAYQKKMKGTYSHVMKHLCLPFVKIFLFLHLTANQITILGIIFSYVAAGLLAFGNLYYAIAAILFLYLGEITDYSDGTMARIRNSVTRLQSDLLCHFYHQGGYALLYFGLGLGLFRITGNVLYIVFGCFGTIGHLTSSYLFETKEHKEAFNANPKKYAPQFGGYCAYGVAVGKKFYSDPTVWKIINRKLYLNLDTNIQAKWNKKMKAYISKAHSNWEGIEHKHPSEL